MPDDPKQQPNAKNIARHIRTLVNALNGLANEADLASNAPPFFDPTTYFVAASQQRKSIQEQNKKLKQQQELILQIQKDTLRIRKDLNESKAMPSIRSHNGTLCRGEPLKYPPGISANGPQLPSTGAELMQMNNIQCQFTAGYLELPSLPGSASLGERRKQIADYLGVPYRCNCT